MFNAATWVPERWAWKVEGTGVRARVNNFSVSNTQKYFEAQTETSQMGKHKSQTQKDNGKKGTRRKLLGFL